MVALAGGSKPFKTQERKITAEQQLEEAKY